VFAAKLIALQSAGGLPAYSGNRLDQIRLYTFGAPRVGNTEFAAYLEENMKERYR
jgi:predicted lipase